MTTPARTGKPIRPRRILRSGLPYLVSGRIGDWEEQVEQAFDLVQPEPLALQDVLRAVSVLCTEKAAREGWQGIFGGPRVRNASVGAVEAEKAPGSVLRKLYISIISYGL